jgi:multidrug transporter EmrE-like cation transporter
MQMALISILLGSVGQVLLKVGVSRLGGVRFEQGSVLPTLLDIATQPPIVVGVLLFGTSMLIWLGVLSSMDLSKAYPIVGLSYVLVTIMSRFLLGEAITASRLAGIALVLAGVTVISK